MITVKETLIVISVWTCSFLTQHFIFKISQPEYLMVLGSITGLIVHALIKSTKKKEIHYEYGLLNSGMVGRIEASKPNELYVLLWKPGEQGHKNGCFVKAGAGHIEHFIKFEK